MIYKKRSAIDKSTIIAVLDKRKRARENGLPEGLLPQYTPLVTLNKKSRDFEKICRCRAHKHSIRMATG